MKSDALRLKELERRVKELESRPQIVILPIQPVAVPQVIPQFVPVYPYGPFWGQTSCISSGTTSGGACGHGGITG